MAVKADWHEGAAAVDGVVDPFASASSLGMPTSLSLDLTASDLRERIVSLFRREKFLFDKGLSCPIKDRCETSCLACPLNEGADPDSFKGRLCRIGVEQEKCETLLAVAMSPEVAPVPAPSEPEPALKW